MDLLETPYDEEAEFIECPVCEKSIRGDTLYKIHLTTPGHLKKEDALVASGLTVRQHTVPVFEDIVQYLDYMKLDEPIIGLNYLDEVPCNDQQGGPKYLCTLCHQTANLAEMVRHVIGRKHRQKYVELKRPDLVTWDKQSILTQGGRIIRARAEIIERQDGRGSPVSRVRRGTDGKLNISRVLPRQRQNNNIGGTRNFNHRDNPTSYPPQLIDHQHEYSSQGGCPTGHPNPTPLDPGDPYILDKWRQMHQQHDTLGCGRMGEELRRADYRESDMYRREYIDPDYGRGYEKEYVEDPQRRAEIEHGGVPRYDPRAEILCGQPQHGEYNPEEASSYRKPYPERDPLKEFYSEEIRRRRIHSAEYQPSQPVRPGGDNQPWSLDRESGRHGSMAKTGRQGLSEVDTKRSSFSTPMSDRSHDHLFNTIRDYCHEMRESHQEQAAANPGPSRTGPTNSQRQMEVTRAISDIPEPFRRFLKGATNVEGHSKRKRKSRFSDATAEEVQTTKEMFSDEYGPPNPKFGGCPRPVSAPSRPEFHRTQHPDHYAEMQGPRHTEGYQRGASESVGVFDILKNVEIENAEEADFLKSKLCDLLKEFKSKKSEMVAQNSHSRAVISEDYKYLKMEPELPPRHTYEALPREDLDLRRPGELYFKEDNRGRGWKQHEHIPEEQLEEYHHPVRGEARHPNSNSGLYEKVFRGPEMLPTSRATHPDEQACYPEMFQKPMRLRDYRPPAENLLDSHSSAPPLHMERGPRMDRAPRYSKNLDKITSTLLELVARK